jgi:hypothetical protein
VPEQDPVLVDTDVASALYLERYYGRRVSVSLAGSLATRQLVVSLITLGEAHYGARKRKWGPPRTSRMLAFYQEMFDIVALATRSSPPSMGICEPARSRSASPSPTTTCGSQHARPRMGFPWPRSTGGTSSRSRSSA